MCLQLTGIMEEGSHGYVQLNKRDMERLIATWQKNVGALKIKESRPTVRAKRPAQQRKGEICRKKHCQLARDGGLCSNITCSTGCGYYRVKLSPVA
jgi:hypothetical protein